MMTQPEESLLEKLGFAQGDTVFVETTPGWYTQFADDNDLELEPGLPATHAHIFIRSRTELGVFLRENDLPQIKASLWVSWPKKDSTQKSDLNEQLIRSALQPLGWVEAGATSIDVDWQGIKFQRNGA